MNRLYLVRHGENRANLTKEFSHHKVDYPLTPKGRLQAQQTAAYLVKKDIHAIYASPLRRAAETAEIIAAELSLPVVRMEGFREVNVGNLEDEPPSLEAWERHDRILEAWVTGHPEARFPGGEDYHELWARWQSGLRQVLDGKENCNLLIVAHGGIFTFTLKDLCPEIEQGQILLSTNHNCSISEVLVWQDGNQLRGQLQRWASCKHLSGEAARLVPGVPEADSFR